MTNPPARRVSFFVDGFNLYHSLCSALRKHPDQPVKWLDLQSLLSSTLYTLEGRCEMQDIYYFTAYAEHLSQKDPQKISRHKAYVRALTASGVKVVINHFKRKEVWDSFNGTQVTTHEEKETDVAIVCRVLRDAHLDLFDVAVVVSGDTDLRPLAETFREVYQGKALLFAFPYDRKNSELIKVAPASFTFSAKAYATHQFPAKVRLPSNKHVFKPEEW
jgi:uncharacterized LabA/DUF88 family protein